MIQPGSADVPGDPGNDPAFLVGAKVAHVPISFEPGASNLVDAALAITHGGLATSLIQGLGSPQAAMGIAMPGMSVVKSGRTTGVTFGTVQASNATVNVDYGPGCGVARFMGQIIITPGNFSAAGDSGSAVLEAEA